MPEANVLYSVTAAVVAGLFVWVAVVLKSAKEPWARETHASAQATTREDDVPIEKVEEIEKREGEGEPAVSSMPPSSSLPKVLAGSAGGAQ